MIKITRFRVSLPQKAKTPGLTLASAAQSPLVKRSRARSSSFENSSAGEINRIGRIELSRSWQRARQRDSPPDGEVSS